MVTRVKVPSVVDVIADDLRRSVLSGEFTPGSALTEVEVATRYEVARATAKAAIDRLVIESVLQRTTNKPARVVRLDADDVRDIYGARVFVESEVVRRLATTRHVPESASEANTEIARRGDDPDNIVDLDMAFHSSLVDATGNARAGRMYRSLSFEVKLCMAQIHGQRLTSPATIASEHNGILKAIAAGDPSVAAERLGQHLTGAQDRLIAVIGDSGSRRRQLRHREQR